MNIGPDRSPLDAVNAFRNASQGQVVLVMQGGGALGAYQGGVYEALHEAGIEPDWIIGTSIGAINASIICGNTVEQRLARLKEFWRRMERGSFWEGMPFWNDLADRITAFTTMTIGVPGFFESHSQAFHGSDNAGCYSTMPLHETLTELVDFKLINQSRPRLKVGAAQVRTSSMRYFDSRDMPLAVEHIMASCALPPAFPPVRIDGELYWDGGILSNYADRGHLRRQSAPQRVDLRGPLVASKWAGAGELLRCDAPVQGHPIFEPTHQSRRPPTRDAPAAPHHLRTRQACA